VNPEGETLTVEGKGYDRSKGIYVAFCVVPPAGQPPSPCGGGQDRSGSSGGSVWVSSNPPLYARGLTTPYGPGGTFKVQLRVNAMLNENTDCRKVVCAVTTRNDHTRSSDRSQDVFVPLHFVGGPTATTAAPAATAPPPPPSGTKAAAVTTTTTIDPQSLAAPLATVSDDRKSITGGGKTLTASQTDGLVRGAQVKLTGSGYDVGKGVYVSLCFINETLAPDPCASGSAGQSAWISSKPPDYGKGLATPYRDGGSFEVTLTLDPVIDAEHDCSKVACALATRNDDTHPGDHSQDLMLPVSFAGNVATRVAVNDADDATDQSSAPYVAGLIALVIVGMGALAYGRIREARS
jgi:hypothetical protein